MLPSDQGNAGDSYEMKLKLKRTNRQAARDTGLSDRKSHSKNEFCPPPPLSIMEIINNDIMLNEPANKRGLINLNSPVQNSKSLLELVSSTSLLGLFILNHEEKIISINNAGAKMIGSTRREAVSKSFAFYVVENDLIIFRKHMQKVAVKNTYAQCQLRLQCGEECTTDTMLEIFPVNMGGVEHNHYIVCIQDITMQAKAEDALYSERQFAQLYPDIEGLVSFQLANDLTIMAVNKGASESLGYAPSELIGNNWLKALVPAAERKDVFKWIDQSQNKLAINKEFNLSLTSREGINRAYRSVIQPLLNEADGTITTIISGIDFEEEMRLKTQLKERVKELNCIVQVRDILESDELTIEQQLRYVAEAIPLAFQFPEKTGARITYSDIYVASQFFNPSRILISKTLDCIGDSYIKFDVSIAGETNGKGANHLLSEESVLVSIIASRMRQVLSMKYQATELDKRAFKLQESVIQLEKMLEAAISSYAIIMEQRDPYTARHQLRVAALAVKIAEILGWEKSRIQELKLASLIHDIGKLSIPAEILNKPGKLNDVEMQLIKRHSQSGFDIVHNAEFPAVIAQTVLQHHERMNGSGYPNNLKGEDIVLEARIVAVADVMEAIASHRPYRPSLGSEKAFEEVVNNRGILYDPVIVDACLEAFKIRKFEFEKC